MYGSDFENIVGKPNDTVKQGLNKTTPALLMAAAISVDRPQCEFKTVTENQIKGNCTDSFVINKRDASGKVHNSERKNTTQKDEIRDLRIQRINKAILHLAQIFNYL